MTRLSRAAGHLLPAVFFVALAVAWTFPLITALGVSVPGEPGDNLDFLWNVWWMREAVASPAIDFFHTDYLFAPFGVDLTLHTHTALPAWIAATLLAPLSTIAAQNVVILGALALNGFAAYLLAWSITHERWSSIAGGVIFGGSSYLAGHLLGHANLIAPWGIPLFLLFFTRAIERRSRTAALAAGVCLALIAFVDYYYLVYAGLIGLALGLAGGGSPVTVRVGGRAVPSWLRRILATLLFVDVCLALTVIVTGGFVTTIAGVRIAATRPTNLLATGWLLLVLWALARWRPRLIWQPSNRATLVDRAGRLWPTALAALAGMFPLIVRAWQLWRAGDYTAPPSSWRSGPPGVDLASFVLGSPWQSWAGPWTRSLYQRFDINPIEGSGWLGIVPLGLVIWAVARGRRDRVVTRWLIIGGVFLVWALGPWLKVGGFDTGLLLPQNFFSFIPILSNARMPGRAMAVVMLAVAMVAAVMLSRIAARVRPACVLAALALIAVDAWIAPIPLTQVETPRIYVALRDLPAGTVCELPVGLRDGFGVMGRFDDRVASYQMTHRHPIVGGFLARIPDSIKRGYAEQPVLRSLFRLSAGEAIDPRDGALDRATVGASLRQAGIRYLVLNRETAPAPLIAYVGASIPTQLVVEEGPRGLYLVDAAAPPASPIGDR